MAGMPQLRKVAFVTPLSTAYMHRLLRGALSFAEARSRLTVRSFQIPRDFHNVSRPGEPLDRLLAWNPDGILGFLENEELDGLLRLLPAPRPVVNTCASPLRPGVAVVVASIASHIEVVARHFREQGLRSLALLSLESEQHMQTSLAEIFTRIVRPPEGMKATFVEVVDSRLLDDPDAPVTPVPERLVKWFLDLPKPCGIYCPQMGGGGYVIRVCHVLGLRVPQDIAVIGGDDTDISLSSNPTLTSVMPLGDKIGHESMRILDEMMAGHPGPMERVRIDAVDLFVRQSTGIQRAHLCDIAAALDYIRHHACGGLSVARLLEATQQVSSKTFHTHFKTATGRTPGEAILQRQLEEARRLLAATNLSVTIVAEKSGFGGSSDFARRFRAAEGMSPSEYRQKAANR